MGSRAKRKKGAKSDAKRLGSRPIIDNLPANGDGKPALPGKVDQGELAIVTGAILEVEGLKKKEMALQRELTLTSADLIRKGDDLTGRLKQMNQKYSIQRGVREVDMKTGMIMDITQPVRLPVLVEPPKPKK